VSSPNGQCGAWLTDGFWCILGRKSRSSW